MCVPMRLILLSHALPALLPLTIKPATRTSRLLLSRRLSEVQAPHLDFLPITAPLILSGAISCLPIAPSPFSPRRGHAGTHRERPELPRARSATRRVRPVGSGTPEGTEPPRRGCRAGPEGRELSHSSGADPCGSGGRRGAGPARVPPVLAPDAGVSSKLRVFYSKSQPVLSPWTRCPAFPRGTHRDTP